MASPSTTARDKIQGWIGQWFDVAGHFLRSYASLIHKSLLIKQSSLM